MLFQPLWSSDLEQYLFQQHGERATGEKTQQLKTHMSLFNMVELDFEASQYLLKIINIVMILIFFFS